MSARRDDLEEALKRAQPHCTHHYGNPGAGQRLCVGCAADAVMRELSRNPDGTLPVREHPLEGLARELIDHLGEIQTREAWVMWRRKHAKTLAALFRSLPDSPTKRKLIALGRAKKAQFETRKRP